MQLKLLKLSGFKSFVDPTVVPLSSQLVGVVGPNGCGKSNIIDAVRWVLGEGSAKNLRGGTMTDVIFNGSSTRKSVGQASVELVFDNCMGRLSGQYASYQEIAIKRVLTRDGDSSYFLNGGRCRKRDITDLFLGTGAGARGYSIIGQNTISQFVEAKPEDLRVYFEEAAGVSQYKERRRETLSRMEQTRENLLRVEDISRELGSQLQRLERQAKAAEGYKALKKDERHYQGDILAFKWHTKSHELSQNRIEIGRLSCTHEAHLAQVAHFATLQVKLESQLLDATAKAETTQTQFYQVANEVARLQEMEQQQAREKQQVIALQEQVKADIQLTEQQLHQDREVSRDAQENLNVLLVQLSELKQIFSEASHALEEKQAEATEWDKQRQRLQTLLNQYQRDKQVAQLQLQHILQRRQDPITRIEKIKIECAQLEKDAADETLIVMTEQQALAVERAIRADEQAQQLVLAGKAVSLQLKEVELALREAQDNLQQLTTKHAVLKASQEGARHKENLNATDGASFQNCARAVELITVEEKWRTACEWVLQDAMHAIVVDRVDSIWPDLPAVAGHSLAFVTPSVAPLEPPGDTLFHKMSGFKPAWFNALEHIFTADSLDEARKIQPLLAKHQSVITADGFWLGEGWLRVANVDEQDEISALLVQQKLAQVQDALCVASESVSELQSTRNGLCLKREENERLQQESQKSYRECHQNQVEATALLQKKQHIIEQASIRLSTLRDEEEALIDGLEQLAEEHVQLEDSLMAILHQVEMQTAEVEAWMTLKVDIEQAVVLCRSTRESARVALHQMELSCSKEQLKIQQLQDTIHRSQLHLDTLESRLVILNQRYHNFDKQDIIPAVSLAQMLERHQQLDMEYRCEKQAIVELQLLLKEMKQSEHAESVQAASLQERLVKLQMAEQACSVLLGTLVESLKEFDLNPEERVATIPVGTTLANLELRLKEIGAALEQLGAVNLVAIEEYQTELVRKVHLDEQSGDLNDAIVMLEAAIVKMDKETELRLKETFDAVNGLFQTLFPRLFGGGQAHLQLTCDNLLESGVLVMAQPPGKRNSRIQSLSGGEKAMTAVALVFAIFQLNPSPFCMLDEVDAPLDDLNVGRFCDLVKEMSQYVQILLISHNKVTMELAEHLIGVTMREPGISRIVAVDVESALSSFTGVSG